MRSPLSNLAAVLALLALAATAPAHALPGKFESDDVIRRAQSGEPPPLQGVDVVEKLGEPVALQARFTDDTGREGPFASWLQPGKPVLLTLVFYRCKMLCNLVVNDQVRAMKELGLKLGQDYSVLTVSIDPKDTPAESQERRGRYLQSMGKPLDADWRFLTGTEQNIRALADSVGFKYTYDEATKQYAHPAVVQVLSPTGTVSRYLYGTSFRTQDVGLALVEARQNKVGLSLERIILSCFKYDAASRRYGFYIFGFLRLGALAVFGALSAMLVVLWRRELKKGTAV
ncbi:SCO family protein [Aggregicoccus sp. 17bor-14]|uniref:SCO family protein n=1 Tax=Myxococcaceae TaxID=31 RepID=UPI00129D201C|nr:MULTISPECIES: SCO family protein [Myxococcaceae]MBF5042286.1 SCO family protein [Simulacricoccus sp. 17bor-14]MRI88060.1 SCO family protein [Aggregicoccus sp. 17bor-14]